MPYWTPEVLDEIRSRCDVAQLVGAYVHLRPQGRNLVGRCPFHDDRSPSFSVSPDKQLFYCFGCQAGGDVFDFVMRKDGLDFGEAVEAIARRVGVTLPERPASPGEVRRRAQREQVLRALAAAAGYFRRTLDHLPGAQPARVYFERRGVTGETRERFGLGYAPGDGNALIRALGEEGYSLDDLVSAGLAGIGSEGRPYDRFRDRVMFPIRDEQGRVIAFGGRVLGDGQPKYLNSPETAVFTKRQVWFALDLARPTIRAAGRAVVMEGYMDVITAHQHGFCNAVASLGTALSQEQAWALARLAREAIIAYDVDAAGTTASFRGIEMFRRAGCEVRIARVPEGKDPDEFLRTRGSDAFRAVLDSSLPLLDFVFEQAAGAHDLSTMEGKVAVVEAILPHLAAEESAVAQDAYLQRLAPRLGIAEEALRRDLARRLRREGRRVLVQKGEEYSKRNGWETNSGFTPGWEPGPSGLPARGTGAGGRRGLERQLLKLLLHHPELQLRAREAVRPDDFEDEHYRRLAARILDSPAGVARSEEHGAALALFVQEEPAIRELAAGLLMEAEGGDPERVLSGCLKRFEDRRANRESAQLERQMAELVAQGAPIPRELGQRWHELQRRAKGSPRG